ncbi:MAG: aminopeptidase [Betaproteobacteria bacterium]|nr:aminopeptidase [Betaproteobacteria bacterium]
MRLLLAATALALLTGCESISFYGQAIGGHLRLMSQAKPLDTWLTDPATPADLKQRLETARGIREFASRELHLPDNGSYTTYADLGRRFAVYNVFAAPTFSVDPKPECFPITGCVAYRGFYSEKDANAYADKLREQGFDVYTGGVLAYSTLGWFDDPLLSTFIRYPDAQVARLVFHELAHQLVYAKGDTTFNESFAVVVEDEGVRRWLDAQGRAADLAAFRAAQERKRDLAARIKETRERLKAIYATKLTPEQMLEQKKGEFDRLRALYPTFVPPEPNNAFLVSIALYNEFVPALERVLAASGSLDAFYERARTLAHEDRKQRDALLANSN